MKKLLLLCCTVFTLCIAHAQWPKVSTGINTSGLALNNHAQDPNWHLGTPNPISTTATFMQPFYLGYWNPTPVSGSNAGWINPSATPGYDIPGIYLFERNFTINPGTLSFTTNFNVACDDNLLSLQLIPPGAGNPIPLTVVFNSTQSIPQYYLSDLIKKKINCPKRGVWTIRAEIDYADNTGGFLLSGRIDTTAGVCDSCSCDSTCKLNVTVGGLPGSPFSCGKTINLKCDKKYSFKPSLTCKGTACTTSVTGVTLTDASNITPAWANAFIAGNGAGSLSIPPGIPAGIYTLTYTYGVNKKKCGTCKYKLNISCKCNCNFSLGYEGYQVLDTVSCGDTLKAVCGKNSLYSPILECTDGTTQLIGFGLTDANGNTPSWAANFSGTGALLVPSTVSGVFTLTYTWGNANGTPCDSCKVYLNVECCPRIPCTLTTQVIHKPQPGQNLNCSDTALLSCNYSYGIYPTLNCTNSPQTQINYVTLHDGAGNTPSWANPFLSGLGNGILIIPNNVFGFYTLKYYWGVGTRICDSCSYTLRIQCCTIGVNAGQDVSSCCPSSGTPITATVSNANAPYSILWSPATGLNSATILNPVCNTTGTYIITVTDRNGCVAKDTIKISYSGVNCCRIAGNKTKAQVYPNPFTNGFVLNLPANSVADVQITNMQGKPEEIKNKASGSVQMGNSLNYGVYTIVIKYKDGTKEQIKVIKNPQ